MVAVVLVQKGFLETAGDCDEGQFGRWLALQTNRIVISRTSPSAEASYGACYGAAQLRTVEALLLLAQIDHRLMR